MVTDVSAGSDQETIEKSFGNDEKGQLTSEVDGTGEDRIILSGIHPWYEPEELIGKTAVAIVNLPPRKMMGQMSNGMLLSMINNYEGEEMLNFLLLDDAIPAGAKLV